MIDDKIKFVVGIALSVFLLTGTQAISAEEDPIAVRKALVAKINEMIKTPSAKKAAIERGNDRTLFCRNCHGIDGNSKRPEIPNLAGQNPAYLVEQVEKFANGERKSLVMQTLAKGFTQKDKIDLAIFYNSQNVVSVEYDKERAKQGNLLYNRLCIFCHGKEGKGEEGFARIAGQKPVYVTNTLKRFRANANDQVNVLGAKRTSARMEQVTQNLSDNDIENIANFVASMK